MRKVFSRLAIIGGLAAVLAFGSGCGLVNMAAGRKAPGEEASSSQGYGSFNESKELRAEPEGNGVDKARWLIEKANLHLAYAKSGEHSEVKRRARLVEASHFYEEGLNLLSKDLEVFYRSPYSGFGDKSLSADFFAGIFEKALYAYRELGNDSRAAFALHHLDWISWNRQKAELHRQGLSVKSVEDMDREGLLADLVPSKYENGRKENNGSKIDSYSVIKSERDRQKLSDLLEGFVFENKDYEEKISKRIDLLKSERESSGIVKNEGQRGFYLGDVNGTTFEVSRR